MDTLTYEVDIRRIMLILGNMVSPEGAEGAPALFIGPPGGGKTTNVKEYARRFLDGNVRVFGAPRFVSSDLGIPDLRNATDHYKFLPPEGVHDLVKEPRGMLFIDELSRARSGDVLGAFLSLILEHETEAIKAKHLHIWAAMNPSDMVGGIKIDIASGNRFVWCPWPEITTERWIEFSLQRDAYTGIASDAWPSVDPDWRSKWPEVVKAATLTVSAFLRHAPDMFRSPVPKVAQAYANERSWSLAVTVLASCMLHGATADERRYLMTGCVGAGAGLAFVQYLSDSGIPDPADIVSGRVKLADLDAYRAWAAASSAIDYLKATKDVDHAPFVQNMVGMFGSYPEVVCPLAARVVESGLGGPGWMEVFKRCLALRERK